MRNFKHGLFLGSLGLLVLPLSACSGENKDIAQLLKEGVVKITYSDKPGHATGFFVNTEGDICTVLTVAHAVPEDSDIRATAYDNRLFVATDVSYADNDDLAIVTFDVEDEKRCPYAPLKLGNSDRLQIDDFVRMAGYPEREGADRLVLQIPSGKVTTIESPPLPDGYAISYDMTTVGGMSGAPVVNASGKVIGIHGLTDIELVSLGRAKQSSLSENQESEIEAAAERVDEFRQINHFKWGIPIATFQQGKTALLSRDTTTTAETPAREDLSENLLSVEDADRQELFELLYDTGSKSYSSLSLSVAFASTALAGLEDSDSERNDGYQRALDRYDKALEKILADSSAPDYIKVWAWNDRGVVFGRMGRDQDALKSFDDALEVDDSNATVWSNRAVVLELMGRTREARKSYKKASELM